MTSTRTSRRAATAMVRFPVPRITPGWRTTARGAHPQTLHSSGPEFGGSTAATSPRSTRALASSSRVLTLASISARARPRDPLRGDEECAHARVRDVESGRERLHDAGTDTQARGSWSRLTSTSSVYRSTLQLAATARRHSSAFVQNRRGTTARRLSHSLAPSYAPNVDHDDARPAGANVVPAHPNSGVPHGADVERDSHTGSRLARASLTACGDQGGTRAPNTSAGVYSVRRSTPRRARDVEDEGCSHARAGTLAGALHARREATSARHARRARHASGQGAVDGGDMNYPLMPRASRSARQTKFPPPTKAALHHMSDSFISAADLLALDAPALDDDAPDAVELQAPPLRAPSTTRPPLHVLADAVQSMATTDGDLRKRCAWALYLIHTGVRSSELHEDARPLYLALVHAYVVLVDEVSTTPLRLDVDVTRFSLPRAQSIARKIWELYALLASRGAS